VRARVLASLVTDVPQLPILSVTEGTAGSGTTYRHPKEPGRGGHRRSHFKAVFLNSQTCRISVPAEAQI
jgi:hypothetical protein